MITALYADGGINRSGKADFGAWAYCLVNETGDIAECDYGLILPKPHGLSYVECNTAEFYALLKGLEALPAGWSGPVHSDSQNTLNRFFAGWKTNGIPNAWHGRVSMAIANVGNLTPILLSGHPTKADLIAGYSNRHKKPLPVSRYNVWCDKQCGEVIRAHKENRPPVLQLCPPVPLAKETAAP